MRYASLIPVALLAACSRQAPQQKDAMPNSAADRSNAAPATNDAGIVEALDPPPPGEPGGLPDDRTPIAEGPTDPRSAQGAGQVVQRYFALLESGRTAAATALWSNKAQEPDYSAYREVHGNIGAPGEPEGAAGSIYVDVPVQLYGRRQDGSRFTTLGKVILRRVNDVPGSTPEQREWRLYRMDLAK